MKSSFAWMEFIRQRAPQVLAFHFQLSRQYRNHTKGHALFHQDGYYRVVTLLDTEKTKTPVTVHCQSIDLTTTHHIDLLSLFYEDTPTGQTLQAYLHSNEFSLLRHFAITLEAQQAVLEHRSPRALCRHRPSIDALCEQWQRRQRISSSRPCLYAL